MNEDFKITSYFIIDKMSLKKLSLFKGGNAEWSVACDDGIFIFPKECRTHVRSSSFFSEKSSEGVLNPSYYINHTTRGNPLRLQKTSFLNPPPL